MEKALHKPIYVKHNIKRGQKWESNSSNRIVEIIKCNPKANTLSGSLVYWRNLCSLTAEGHYSKICNFLKNYHLFKEDSQ